jgi:hypothetical protein
MTPKKYDVVVPIEDHQSRVVQEGEDINTALEWSHETGNPVSVPRGSCDCCLDAYKEWSDSEINQNRKVSAVGPYSFCAACMKLFQFERLLRNRGIKHHQSLKDLLKAADEECPVCFRIVRELHRCGARPILEQADGYRDTHLRMKATQSDMCGMPSNLEFTIVGGTITPNSQGKRTRIETVVKFDGEHEGFEEGSLNKFTAIYENRVNAIESISSTEMIDIEGWLKTCTEHHSCWNSATKDYLPPRLLDCRTDRLVLREAAQIDLKGDTKYLTLSHCWGKGPKIILRSDNMNEFYGGIDHSLLPPTFRDAVEIAKKLKIPYLWIDSLCIIQKGPQHEADWQKHVLEMAEIYSNCYLNVAASKSTDSDGGCFAPKPRALNHPCLVMINGKRAVFEQQSYCDVKKFNLYSRAWVFQERLLSPRVVHYHGSEVFWECHESFASDLFPHGHPRLPINTVAVSRPEFHWQPPSYIKDPYEYWLSLISEYASCNLTMSTDRFPGIAAVARRMNETYFHEEYVAGFYKPQLPVALEWKKKKFATLKVPEGPYIAPSWSWASIHGPLEFPVLKNSPVAIVKSYAIDLVEKQNKYGQMSYARLVVEGQILRVPSKSPTSLEDRKTVLLGQVIGAAEYETYSYQWPLKMSRPWKTKKPPLVVSIDIDICWDRDIAEDSDVWHLLLISERSGIVLVPMPVLDESGRPAYRRVGVWHRYVWNGDWEDVVKEFKVQVEEIVLV